MYGSDKVTWTLLIFGCYIQALRYTKGTKKLLKLLGRGEMAYCVDLQYCRAHGIDGEVGLIYHVMAVLRSMTFLPDLSPRRASKKRPAP